MVIFSIGVNDSHGPNFSKQYFVNNYDSLVKLVHEANPDCAILFTTVTDNWIAKGRKRYPNKKMPAAYEAIQDLGKKH